MSTPYYEHSVFLVSITDSWFLVHLNKAVLLAHIKLVIFIKMKSLVTEHLKIERLIH